MLFNEGERNKKSLIVGDRYLVYFRNSYIRGSTYEIVVLISYCMHEG